MGRILSACFAYEPPAGLRVLRASRRGDGPNGLAWEIGGPAPAWPEDAIVLHLAGTTGPRDPGANPRLIPPLVAACQRNGLRHLVYLSTAAIYAPGTQPARESDPPAPLNPYGAAKLEAEHLLTAAGMPLTILRLGNLAGADALLSPRAPGEKVRLDPVPGDARGPLRSWIGPLTFARSLAALLGRIAANEALPPVLNLVQAPPLGMADLLRASGLAWEWGEKPAQVPAAILDNGLIESLMPLPEAEPTQIIAEIRELRTRASTLAASQGD